MFDLLNEISKRELIISENDLNKETAERLLKAYEEAKAKVRTDEEIRNLGVEIEQIKEICYKLGTLDRPNADDYVVAEE